MFNFNFLQITALTLKIAEIKAHSAYTLSHASKPTSPLERESYIITEVLNKLSMAKLMRELNQANLPSLTLPITQQDLLCLQNSMSRLEF